MTKKTKLKTTLPVGRAYCKECHNEFEEELLVDGLCGYCQRENEEVCVDCGKPFKDGNYVECDRCGVHICDQCDADANAFLSDTKLCKTCKAK